MTILFEYIIIISINHSNQLICKISANISLNNNTAIAFHKLCTVGRLTSNIKFRRLSKKTREFTLNRIFRENVFKDEQIVSRRNR